MTRTILAVLVGVALNVAVFTEPTYPIYGQGNSSCGAWINAAPNDFAFRAWVNGFVTAAAIPPNALDAALLKESGLETKPLRHTDRDGINLFITQYCFAHPTDTIYTAATQLVMTLTPP
jgi:hypothetical protein